MGAYENWHDNNEWYTPKYIFDALRITFDLDVAAPKEGPKHVPCRQFISEDSLKKNWRGTVWMNPPFGNQKNKMQWIEKFADHANGIALLPDRTSASWWQHFVKRVDVICFVHPRIQFEQPDGTKGIKPGIGTTLFAVGARCSRALIRSELGVCMRYYDRLNGDF